MLPFFSPKISNDTSLINKVLKSKFVSEGKITEKFEKELKKFLNIKYCATVNSGTSAIHLALIASNVKRGDEVIVPAQTFIASALPIIYIGAKPVFADIDSSTGNISSKGIKKLITKKTKALIVVHWGGYPCDLDEIKKTIRGKNIKIIEDAAHCFGGKYKNKNIGSISDFTCFSFQATKHLTSGDGGLICCKKKSDEKRIKKLRWFGFDRNLKKDNKGARIDRVSVLGYKYQLNNYSAALGLSNLKNIKSLLNHHVKIGNYYSKKLKNIPFLKILNFKKNRLHTYWFYQLLADDRSKFIKILNEIDFPYSIVDKRIDNYQIFKKYKKKLPSLEQFEKKKISLPVNYKISKKHIDKLVGHIKKKIRQNV